MQPLAERVHQFGQPSAPSTARLGGGDVLGESFAGPTFPPEGWAVFDNDGDTRVWTRTVVSEDTVAVNRFASSAVNGEDYIVTPLLSPVPGQSTIQYDLGQDFTGEFGSTVSVLVSNASDGGTQTNSDDFVALVTYTEADLPIDSFATFELDLSAYEGANVYVAFLHENSDGDSIFLDDVGGIPLFQSTVTPDCPTYASPEDGATDVPYGTLVFDWNAATTGEAASGYTLELGTGADLGLSFDAGSDTEIEIIGFPLSTTLFYRVTPRNTAGDNTSCPIFSFTTAGPTETFPYEETFDRGGDAPPLWFTPLVQGQSWDFVQSVTYGADEDHTTGMGYFASIDDSTPEAADTELVSPVFDLSALGSARVSFWYQNADPGEAISDPPSVLNVDVSFDGGSTYTEDVFVVTGTFTEWTEQFFDLDTSGDVSQVRVRFRGNETPDFRSDISLDDFSVEEGPTEPMLAVSPEGAFDFGDVVIGETDQASFTLTNTGGGTLMLGTLDVAGDVPPLGADLPADFDDMLEPGESTTFTATFAPTEAGIFFATVSIFDQAGDLLDTVEVTGTGVSPLSVSPEGPVAFVIPVGAMRSEDITVTNIGSGTLDVGGFRLVGDDVFMLSSTDGAQLAPGESITVTVTFMPNEEADVVATLQVLDGADEVAAQVAFAGGSFTGVVYNEAESGGDCGSFTDTACELPDPNAGEGQRISAYTDISGSLVSGADTDLYIVTFLGGRFTASSIGGASFDTELFLLDETGALVASNDDAGGTVQSTIDIVTPPLPPGQYFLGIGAFNTVYVAGPPAGITSSSTATTERAYTISIGNGNVVPVEMTGFASRVDAGAVVLEWTTASETNNAGFDVQMRRPGADAFESVTFVEGAGTTSEPTAYSARIAELQPGTHVFRLRQVDRDGTATLTSEVEASVVMTQAFALSTARPNPFSQQARFDLAVQQAQDVRVAVYDMLGREVALLHDGPFEAESAKTLTLDGSALAAGAYVVRVLGERFDETMRVTVVR